MAASEWADRTPVQVEVPFATEIGGVVVRGRAGFHYVAENVTVRPADLLDADELATLITGLPKLAGDRAPR